MRVGKLVGAITLAVFAMFLKSYYMKHLGIDPAKARRDFDAVATQLHSQNRSEPDAESEDEPHPETGKIQTNPYLKN